MQDISKTGPKAFKDISAAPTKTKLGLPKKEIKAWQDARRGEALSVVGGADIKINIGFPKGDDPAEVPVLAAATFKDRWEVLSVNGRTHRFSVGEIASVEERRAA